MAFDLNKIKQNLSSENVKSFLAKRKDSGAKSSEGNPLLANAQQGAKDVKTVLEEGKFSLFVKQIVVLLLVFLLVRYASGKIADHRATLKDKMTAINIQQLNKEDYLANKQHLLRLEPLFPDNTQKSEWFLRHLIDLFASHDLPSNIDGNITEDSSNRVYSVMSRPITFQESFKGIGKLIADVENGDDFLRISSISISKLTDAASLGKNSVTLQFNTVFPKEKYAAQLFKDYKQQMEQIRQAETKPVEDAQ